MFETVWRILRHSQDAEDALPVALTTIWQQRSRIECHPAPQALILKICAGAAIVQYRRRRTDQRNLVPLADRLPSPPPPPIHPPLRHDPPAPTLERISPLSP